MRTEHYYLTDDDKYTDFHNKNFVAGLARCHELCEELGILPNSYNDDKKELTNRQNYEKNMYQWMYKQYDKIVKDEMIEWRLSKVLMEEYFLEMFPDIEKMIDKRFQETKKRILKNRKREHPFLDSDVDSDDDFNKQIQLKETRLRKKAKQGFF